MYEGKWGWIEDVENWSMKDLHMIKLIYFYTDYRIDVNKFRKKFSEALKDNDKWGQRTEPVVQVTDMKKETLEIRALCSAKDAPSAWELRCDLREALVTYITQLEKGTNCFESKSRFCLKSSSLVAHKKNLCLPPKNLSLPLFSYPFLLYFPD